MRTTICLESNNLLKGQKFTDMKIYRDGEWEYTLPGPGVPAGVLVRLLQCEAIVTWSNNSERFIRLFIKAFVLASGGPLLREMVFTSWKNFSLRVPKTKSYYTEKAVIVLFSWRTERNCKPLAAMKGQHFPNLWSLLALPLKSRGVLVPLSCSVKKCTKSRVLLTLY